MCVLEQAPWDLGLRRGVHVSDGGNDFIGNCFQAVTSKLLPVVSQCKEVPMTMNETTTPHPRLILNDVTPLRNVQTVQELPNILVPHPAYLLDVGSALRNVLKRVSSDLELILHVL